MNRGAHIRFITYACLLRGCDLVAFAHRGSRPIVPGQGPVDQLVSDPHGTGRGGPSFIWFCTGGRVRVSATEETLQGKLL